MANVVGPGAVKQSGVTPDPSLKGASEHEYVEILNPLTDDFMVQVAQDVPVNMPFQIHKDESGRVQYLSNNESDVRTNYGLNLKNPDHTGKKQIFNNTVIPSGKTKIFRGNEAQVVVRQLVNEILQRRGKNARRLLSDPVQRKEVEDEIIVRRGFVQELMDSNFQSEKQQINNVINKANEGLNEFPELDGAGTPTTGADSVSRNDTEKSEGKDSKAKKAS